MILSALLAALPLVLLFLLLGVFKVKAWGAALVGLVASIAVTFVARHLLGELGERKLESLTIHRTCSST